MDILNFFAMTHAEQEWTQITGLMLAFVLSSLIGFERELKLKSAGLRTHALVGLAGALLMIISKYGFTDVLVDDHFGLDPSRVAAQIVSGIGFIGGGLIFVRKDIVHGLTTAATIWLTAAIGMACGAGIYVLSLVTTFAYFVVVFGYTWIMNLIRGSTSRLLIRYRIGHDAAASVLSLCSAKDFSILGYTMGQQLPETDIASVEIRVQGRAPVATLVDELLALPAIVSVDANPPENE